MGRSTDIIRRIVLISKRWVENLPPNWNTEQDQSSRNRLYYIVSESFVNVHPRMGEELWDSDGTFL